MNALQIVELTTNRYGECASSVQPILTGSNHGWNASGMHHIDAHMLADGSWIACVDGWR